MEARCELCGGAQQWLGQLGRRSWWRCRSCHHEASTIDPPADLRSDEGKIILHPGRSDLVESGELWDDVDSQVTDREDYA